MEIPWQLCGEIELNNQFYISTIVGDHSYNINIVQAACILDKDVSSLFLCTMNYLLKIKSITHV